MNSEDIKKAIEKAYREGYAIGRMDGVNNAVNVLVHGREVISVSQILSAQDKAWWDSQARCFSENGMR